MIDLQLLRQILIDHNLRETSERFGVSPTVIRKLIRRYNINYVSKISYKPKPKPPRLTAATFKVELNPPLPSNDWPESAYFVCRYPPYAGKTILWMYVTHPEALARLFKLLKPETEFVIKLNEFYAWIKSTNTPEQQK